MKKVIRDGKVAVLYSPGYGAGWSTWYIPVEGIFHPELIEAVERNASADIIESITKRLFGDSIYIGDVEQLEIEWIEEGEMFTIIARNGYESIVYAKDMHYITA